MRLVIAKLRIGKLCRHVPAIAVVLLTAVGAWAEDTVPCNQSEYDHFETELLNRDKALGQNHPSTAHIIIKFAEQCKTDAEYAKAESLLLKAIEIQQKSKILENRDWLVTANRLAWVYYDQGKYSNSEHLCAQLLKLQEESDAVDSTGLKDSLYCLASVYMKQSRFRESEKMFVQGVAIVDKRFGNDSVEMAEFEDGLGLTFREQDKDSQSESHFLRALQIREKVFGADGIKVSDTLDGLGGLYVKKTRYVEAELIFNRSLSIREKLLGHDHPKVADSLDNLVSLYITQEKFLEAETIAKRALSIRDKLLGNNHPSVAKSLQRLSRLYVTQGKFAQAEPLIKQALDIRIKVLGESHPSVADSLIDLAELYKNQGKYFQSEPLIKSALEIQEKTLGFDHPSVARSLKQLGTLYRKNGQLQLAEPLLRRALIIKERSLGPDHPDVAWILSDLAVLYMAQKRYNEAESLLMRALEIKEKTLGGENSAVADDLQNIGKSYLGQGKDSLAEPVLLRALAIQEKALGTVHPSVANTLDGLIDLYKKEKQFQKALTSAERALEIRKSTLGADHPQIANSLRTLAGLHDSLHEYNEALSLMRQSNAVVRQRIVAGGTRDSVVREALQNQKGFYYHLNLLDRNPESAPLPELANEALQIMQLAQASGTASAVAKMAARFATGEGELATLIKTKQDLSERLAKREAQLVDSLSKPAEEREDASGKRLRQELADAARMMHELDAEITRRFPKYQELTRTEPVTVNQVRALLKSDEALIVYALGKTSFALTVRTEGAWLTNLKVKSEDIAYRVGLVRAKMEMDGNGQLPECNVLTLNALFTDALEPIEWQLKGIKHLLVVPNGALQSIPFGMLVSSTPPMINRIEDYQSVDWLIKRYAISVLPSVGSIQAFRQFTQSDHAQLPFTGFGDPAIGDESDGLRSNGARQTKVDISGAFRGTLAQTADEGVVVAFDPEVADVNVIRRAESLPDTAKELLAMAKTLKADEHSVWLRNDATETNLKRMDLSKYRILAFATHGVLAGQLKGVGEPGLILTPPSVGTLEDDGYLAASEIARLKLNADWVILSACNTAASDGTPGAEGLSGMAKAFFYAGARSLLVSHWPVVSEATVPLTTAMLNEYESNPGQGKARAQQKAMLALMNTPDHPEYAHPLYWAPFVVVGDGGQSAGK